jgi:hypothetical protein
MDELAGIIANDPAMAALRGAYAFNIAVFGVLLLALWRPLEGGETLRRSLSVSYGGYRGMVRSQWLALFLLSAAGLVLPLVMVPVLVLQVICKAAYLWGTELNAVRRGHGIQSHPLLILVFALVVLVWPPVLVWALAG